MPSGERILVVDDVAANRLLLRRFLQGKGWRVEEAESGVAALDWLQRQSYDLILMDIMMAGMDGREAARRIKEQSGGSHLPIIFVTALSSERAYIEALAAGGDDYLTKPVNLTVLEAKVRAHLRIKALGDQLEQNNAQLQQVNRHLARERELVKHLFMDAYRRNYHNPACLREFISPVAGFNGDVLLTALGPAGRLYLLLGDFTGHGLLAAIGTLPLKQVFFEMAQQGCPLSEMVRELNRRLREFLSGDIFCAAQVVQLNIQAGELLVWSGGVPEGYLIDDAGERLQVLASRHMPLGVLEDHEFDPALDLLRISSGFRLYLYTDGLIEAADGAGRPFGEAQLLQMLRGPVAGRFERVLERVRAHVGAAEQQDDIAWLEVDLGAVLQLSEGGGSRQGPGAGGPLLPLRLRLELGEDEMRRFDIPPLVSAMLAQQPALVPHRDLLQTLLGELYNNALEHSLLGLGFVDKSDTQAFLGYYRDRAAGLQALGQARMIIELRVVSQVGDHWMELEVSDNGRGFDPAAKLEAVSETGRGLGLLQGLCDSLEYADDGRRARARYRLFPAVAGGAATYPGDEAQ